ncbi:RIKEN cDNA 1700016D06, isoform CRA_b, partial [Mus musculus]
YGNAVWLWEPAFQSCMASPAAEAGDKQKEILFQLRSLEALEKMIDKIRRAIETKLKRRQKLQQSRSSQLLGKPIQP